MNRSWFANPSRSSQCRRCKAKWLSSICMTTSKRSSWKATAMMAIRATSATALPANTESADPLPRPAAPQRRPVFFYPELGRRISAILLYMVRRQIEAAIKEVLISLGASGVEFVVERPSDLSHGDYATNAALAAAKILKRNPKLVAQQIVDDLRFSTLLGPDSIQRIESAGAGFINFYLTPEALASLANKATYDQRWANNALYEGQVVMVEYTQPNPFKPFHIGHLMSNTLGE